MKNKKPLAVFDIDGTVFRSSLIIEMTNALIEKGLFPISARSEFEESFRKWMSRIHPRAYEDYVESLVGTYLKHIKGLSARQVEIVSETVTDQQYAHTYVYTRDLIKKLAKTHYLVAISGSPFELVGKFTKRYGFNETIAAEYEVVDNIYTGKVLKTTHTNKHGIVQEIFDEERAAQKGSIAAGDSKGDISMLEMVENPIAFNPDQELLKKAVNNKWQIIVERKNVFYTLEHNNDRYELAETN